MTNLDDLLDELTPANQVQGMRCTLGVLLKELPDTTRQKLQVKIDDLKISSGQISKVLIESGHQISADIVQRHRRRSTSNGCRCAR